MGSKFKKSILMTLCGFFALTAVPQLVFADGIDLKPPVVLSLTLDKHSVSPGDTVTVTCEVADDSEIATDPESGLKTFLYLKNGTNYSDSFYFEKQQEGIYKAVLKITDTFVNGRYSLSYFVITDEAGNEYSTYHSWDFPDVYFDVCGASSDTKAPVVQTLLIDRKAAVPGDQVTITCEVIDDSDIDTDMFSTYLYLKNGNYYSEPFVFEKKAEGSYAATITIPETYVNGRYLLSEFVMKDIVGNEYSVYSSAVFPDVYFEVSGASTDFDPPVVTSLTVESREVAIGDAVTIRCEVEDESEIDTGPLNCCLYLKNGSFYSEAFSFEKKEEGVYEASLEIKNSYVDGNYLLHYFIVTDVIGNRYMSDSAADYPEVFFRMSGNPAPAVYKKPGWYRANDIWYYNDSRGRLVRGWIHSGGKWYYANADGQMQTGWQFVNGKWYYMDSSGAMQTGWQLVGGSWYLLSSFGDMLTGWRQLGGKWYFMSADGRMQTGFITLGRNRYYLDRQGVLKTGWISAGGSWYYAGSSGKVQTGWVKEGGSWYLLKPDGVMAANEWYGGYWLDPNGAWRYTPQGTWRKTSIGWWFGDTSGWYAKNQTVKINGVNYTFDSNGYWVE